MRLFKNLNFLERQRHDVHAGHHAVLQPGDDAAVPAVAHGLHGGVGRPGAFRRRLLLLFLMPIVGVLIHQDCRRVIWLPSAGSSFRCGMYYSTQRLDLDISFRSASVLRLVQVFGLGFLFVPINLVSYVGMPPEKSNSVAGLVNFMRNIGSSVGTSMVTTLIARRAQVHQVYLAAHVAAGKPAFQRSAGGLAAHVATSSVGPADASKQAYALLYQS